MYQATKTAIGANQKAMTRSPRSTLRRKSILRTARMAYRARIESLLDESRDEQLVQLWQRVGVCHDNWSHEMLDRRGMIVDLADFAMVLQLNLHGMTADRLVQRIEKYAASKPQ